MNKLYQIINKSKFKLQSNRVLSRLCLFNYLYPATLFISQ